jgi:GTPase
MTTGKLDNGDGSARVTVANYPHEIKSKKTSSISSKTIITKNNKPITLIDLCGQEQYFKTTVYGISGHFPDYSFLIVGANKGILPMTKQHATILLSNNIPIIIVITRYDITPENIYLETRKMIENYCKNIIKIPAEFINSPFNSSNDTEDYKKSKLELINTLLRSDNSRQLNIPVITISNKNGYYIDFVQNMMSHLKVRNMWNNFDQDTTKQIEDRCYNRIIKNFMNHMDKNIFTNIKNNTDHVFFVDAIYNKNGIGLIIAGMNRGGIINVGDTMYLGPFGKEFKEVRVKSMQNYLQQKISSAHDHHRVTIAIGTTDKDITRSSIRKGMILVKSKELVKKYMCWRFDAVITILNHSATLKNGYAPMLQIGNVRQTGRMIYDPAKNNDKEIIKSKDFALVSFKFKQRLEYIEPYQIFSMRSGCVHGIGVIINVHPYFTDDDCKPDPQKFKNHVVKFTRK